MNKENMLIDKWRSLSPDKQQSILDFVDFLSSDNYNSPKGGMDNISQATGEQNNVSLEGAVIYYEDPLEPVAIGDWEVLQ